MFAKLSRSASRLPAARMMSSVLQGNPTALCETTAGSFKVELFVKEMPITASNFADLAQLGFYDGLHFHRVLYGLACHATARDLLAMLPPETYLPCYRLLMSRV